MQLAATVVGVVLLVTVVTAVLGILIQKNAERHDREGGRR